MFCPPLPKMLDEFERKGSRPYSLLTEPNFLLLQSLTHFDEIFLRNSPLVERLGRALAVLAMSSALRTPDGERHANLAAIDGRQGFEKSRGSFVGICEGMEMANELLECLERDKLIRGELRSTFCRVKHLDGHLVPFQGVLGG